MTRVLVWKELREQRAVWLALAVAGAGCVAALHGLLSDNRERGELLAGVLIAAAWGYGLVCGALQLAGESEEGTQVFLDTLPGSRGQLWTVKVCTGLALLIGFTATMGGVALAYLRVDAPERAAWFAAGITFCALFGYAWGLLCGATASNVLGAVARAVFGQAAAYLLTFLVLVLPVVMLLGQSAAGSGGFEYALLALDGVALAVAAVVVSHRVYCRPDRLRGPAARVARSGGGKPSWGVLLWLAWQQSRGFALVMLGLALLGVLLAMVGGVGVWPPLSLLLGVLFGVTAFDDEQVTGAYRFLADQRFPLGRIWLVKTLLRVGVGLAALVVLLIGVAAVVGVSLALFERQEAAGLVLEQHLLSRGLVVVLASPVLFVLVWPAYGFTVGHLCGVLFRKPPFAAAVALGVGLLLAGLWVPSLIAGGLSTWQVFGAPAVLLLGARLLMRPWAADRLQSAGAVRILADTLLAAALCLAVGLWYRVAQVPEPDDAIDLPAFFATLPDPEQNAGGRQMQAALRQLNEVSRNFVSDEMRPVDPPRPAAGPQPGGGPPGAVEMRPVRFFDYVQQCQEVRDRGWAAGNPRLGAFLDLVFVNTWAVQLTAAAAEPHGIVVDPRTVTLDAPFLGIDSANPAAAILVARGLQRQAEGDPAAFVEYLDAGLALARNLRRGGLVFPLFAGWQVEGIMLTGVERWLEALDGQPKLLQRVLAILRAHEADRPPDPDDMRRASYATMLNTAERPEGLLPFLRFSGARQSDRSLDADLLAFAWRAPWERERLRRLLVKAVSLDRKRVAAALEQLPLVFRFFPSNGLLDTRDFHTQARQSQLNGLCRVRGCLLLAALRLYEAETGAPAPTLDALVPRYLPAVPADPYDGRPYRYRLSQGERIDIHLMLVDQIGMPPALQPVGPQPEMQPFLTIAKDQGIVWSVGSDGQDDGAHTQRFPNRPTTQPGEDVIFVVPRPPKR